MRGERGKEGRVFLHSKVELHSLNSGGWFVFFRLLHFFRLGFVLSRVEILLAPLQHERGALAPRLDEADAEDGTNQGPEATKQTEQRCPADRVLLGHDVNVERLDRDLNHEVLNLILLHALENGLVIPNDFEVRHLLVVEDWDRPAGDAPVDVVLERGIKVVTAAVRLVAHEALLDVLLEREGDPLAGGDGEGALRPRGILDRLHVLIDLAGEKIVALSAAGNRASLDVLILKILPNLTKLLFKELFGRGGLFFFAHRRLHLSLSLQKRLQLLLVLFDIFLARLRLRQFWRRNLKGCECRQPIRDERVGEKDWRLCRVIRRPRQLGVPFITIDAE
mmetsp:Transcript_7717/g.25583  ORF Transcript_7717/g.25583 Transcript_7717/m.25583 type:complete len:335 (+) Transcript_7717:3027-4031(+)